jgi:hypothetical protein
MSAPAAAKAEKPAVVKKEVIPTHFRYNKFDKLKLSITPSEKKETTSKDSKEGAGQKIVYHVIQVLYDYGTETKRSVTEFKVELCKLTSAFGIQVKDAQNGSGKDYSIMVKFNTANDEQKACVDFFDQLYIECGKLLFPVRGTVKLPGFNASSIELMEATGLKPPVYRPRDETTNELIPGRQPTMFFKLFKRGKEPNVIQTLFVGLDGKAIPWDLLIGSEIEFIPLILVKRMFFGTKNSIQMEMLSAVVTSLKAVNSETNQTDTIEEIIAHDPMALENVLNQVALLSEKRLNVPPVMPGDTVKGDDNNDTDGAGKKTVATNAGIGEKPKKDTKSETMSEFTAGAPTRAKFGSLKLTDDNNNDNDKFN